jgi:hypothetical protein
MNDIETQIVWEATVVKPPEFRLYYDDRGAVVCYTTENLEGNYVVIDALTFAQSRPDVRVVDGKVLQSFSGAVVSKLYPNTVGMCCASEDISIVVDDTFQGDTTRWKLITHEYR